MTKFSDIKGFAFDLDGVLADTAKFHTIAWRQIATEVGTPWSKELEDSLKGIDRMDSLEKILMAGHKENGYSQSEKEQLAVKKNEHYLALIAKLTPADILPGMHHFLKELKAHGYKMSVASASRNAPYTLKKLEIAGYFVGVVDPAKVKKGKPDPAIFSEAAKLLDLPPAAVIGLEDSPAGVDSINAAGETAVGIGDQKLLAKAAVHFTDTSAVSLAAIAEKMA